MTPQSQRILREVLDLPPVGRAELVEQILASLESPVRQDVATAWAQEVEDRVNAYERGEIELSPAPDVLKEAGRHIEREKEAFSRRDAGAQRMTENELGTIIIEAAITVHRELGPGLLETVYEVALAYELRQRGLTVERQVPIPIQFRGIRFDEGFKADLLVEDRVIVELKSAERVTPAHKKQIQTHLRLAERKLGYLLNFGEALMKDGITRAVNGLEE